jgi:hypothetical protein
VNGPQLRIAASAPLPASLVVRYNVVAVDDAGGAPSTAMTVRFRDSSAGARVIVALNCMVALDFSHNACFIEARLTKSAGR